MLRHYLITAIRHVIRHPGYAAINILGLAVDMTCCALLLLYVRDEFSYDRFHEHRACRPTYGDGCMKDCGRGF